MKLVLLSFFVSIVLFSCQEKTQFPVSPDKMVSVLTDVHIAEAAVAHLTATKKDSTLRVYYDQIYQIHEISQENFDSTMKLLRSNPKWLEQTYERVMERINVQKTAVTK